MNLLNRLREAFNLSIHADRVTWAMACTATYGLMRCGEVAADSLCVNTFLTTADLDFNDDKSLARIFLISSKCDTKHMGLLSCEPVPLLSVSALSTLITLSKPSHPLPRFSLTMIPNRHREPM